MVRSNNDCGVFALSKLTGLEYIDAKTLLFRHGWCSTKGVNMLAMELALDEAGFELKRLTQYEGYTLDELKSFVRFSTADRKVPLLITVYRHVVAVDHHGNMPNINGTVGRKVTEAYLVSKS